MEKKTTEQTPNEKPKEEVNPVKEAKKSKVGKFYNKIQYFESSKDGDQTTKFDLKGNKKKIARISLPANVVRILNSQSLYSGIVYEEVK